MTGWMSPLKREQARRERESGLRDVNSLETLLWRQEGKVSHELIIIKHCKALKIIIQI